MEYFSEQFIEDNYTNKPMIAYQDRHKALQVLKMPNVEDVVEAIDFAKRFDITDLPEATWQNCYNPHFIMLLGWMSTKKSTALLSLKGMKYNALIFRKGKEVAFRYLKTGQRTLLPDSAVKATSSREPGAEEDKLDRTVDIFYFWDNQFQVDIGPSKIPRAFVPLRDRMNCTDESIPFYYTLETATYKFAPGFSDREDVWNSVSIPTNVTPLLTGSKVWNYSRYLFEVWPTGLKYINFSKAMVRYSGSPLMVWLRSKLDYRPFVRLKESMYMKFLSEQYIQSPVTMRPLNMQFVEYTQGDTFTFNRAGEEIVTADQALLDLIGEFDDDDDI